MKTELTEQSFASGVWSVLSRLDVGDHIDQKGRFSYLKWSWGWAQLMNLYPDSTYKEHRRDVHEDGSVTVRISVTVREKENEVTRKMWLPVMDISNNAILKPTSRNVSDSTMRCLVKCLAMFGLGLDLYAGSDMPVGAWEDTVSDEQAELLSGLYEKLSEQRQTSMLKWQGVKSLNDIKQANYKDVRTNLEKAIKDQGK